MTLGQLRNVLARHSRWCGEDAVVRATTPHGSYTFEIGGVTITPLGISADAVMLHLREIPTMTTDRTEIRNSADDDEAPTIKDIAVLRLQDVSDKLRATLASNREYTRLFVESQEVARTAVAEIKRLREFIVDEFILDASAGAL